MSIAARPASSLKFYYANEENGQKLRRYWTKACRTCPLKHQCTTGKERRITRWEHEHVVEAVQRRLDREPAGHAPAARDGRASVRHDQGAHGRDALPDEDAAEGRHRDGAHVLAYNLTRVMNIVGIKPLMAAIRA